MGLRDAIRISNVPIYQELARRIGLERMRQNVAKLGYGNKDIGTTVDTFWLHGPLKISAVEQTRFLAKLAEKTLPYPKKFQQEVHEIIFLGKNGNKLLYGKTGWGNNTPGPDIGWWVGWLQDGDRIYTFALNMDIKNASDVNKRLELGKASLKILGLL